MALATKKGSIHISPKQRDWVGGVGKMPTFAYMVGGWVKANAYVSKILEITSNFYVKNQGHMQWI